MAEQPDSLLTALAAEAATVAEHIADLEQQQTVIRQELAVWRALRSELLWSADALNRQRLG
jgi:hypothetical protein